MKLLNKAKAKIALLLSAVMSIAGTVMAFAEETPGAGSSVDVASQLSTAATDATTQINSVITTLFPIVLGVIVTVIVVFMGIRMFKKFIKQSNG